MLEYFYHNNQSDLRPHVLAVETSIVDLAYPEHGGDPALKRAYFSQMKELITNSGGTALFDDNPRAGDSCMVSAEDFEKSLLHFGRLHGLLTTRDVKQANDDAVNIVREAVFGMPTPAAGGSLANTAYTLMAARFESEPVIAAKFLSAVGADQYGTVFKASFSDNGIFSEQGRQTVCHVFPVDNDRILVTTPSATDAAESYINRALLEQVNMADYDRIMLGGFLFFTPHFDDVTDHVRQRLSAVPKYRRPSLAVTAAAKPVASSPVFQDRVRTLSTVADTLVHANTGEFRRILNMDDDWRRPFDEDFKGLRGQELDQAKKNHLGYQNAKVGANEAALEKALKISRAVKNKYGTTLRFAVTNGSRDGFFVSPQGIETFTPRKMDGGRIVSTVGAGDNFAAGVQLADLIGASHDKAAALGNDFARAVLQTHAPRLQKSVSRKVAGNGRIVRLGGPLIHAHEETIKARFLPDGHGPSAAGP